MVTGALASPIESPETWIPAADAGGGAVGCLAFPKVMSAITPRIATAATMPICSADGPDRVATAASRRVERG